MTMAATPSVQAVEPPASQAVSHQANYQIRSQSLDRALVEFSLKSGLQVIADGKLTAGVKSPGVSGRYSPEQALQKLLAGNGVKVQSSRNGTVTLERAVVAQLQSSAATASAITLKPMTVVGEAVQDPNDPFNKSYTVTNSFTAIKTDTPIMDIPQSIQVVPRAVMNDQETTRITDALENVSGVRAQPSLGTGNNFLIRGFQNQNIYRNGLRANNSFRQEYDTANLQSIEALKGPAQLYGRMEPGGMINLTTKKPLDIPYYSLEQRFGSYDLYRTEWDATGPFTSDKSLLYRFTGSYQINNSFRDFVSNDRMLFAPSITWRPTESTDATLELQVNNQDFISDVGIPVIGNRPAQIPISRSLGDPNTPDSNLNQVFLNSLLNHRFNEDWAIHSRFLASWDHGDDTFVNPTPRV